MWLIDWVRTGKENMDTQVEKSNLKKEGSILPPVVNGPFCPCWTKNQKKSAVTRAFECGWNVLDNELVDPIAKNSNYLGDSI